MIKEDVGKIFTTTGKDRWRLVWYIEPGTLFADSASTYQMKEEATGEVLTQVVFLPQTPG